MKLLIGGELVAGAGDALDVEEPARGEVFASVALPSEAQVDAAIGAACAAAGGWAAMPSGERAELLHEVATRVEHSVYDDFVSAFVDHARSLRVGDPLAEGTDIGPMVSESQRGKVEAQLEAAGGAGAEVVFGGDHAGFKQSGLGRELGQEGLEAFQETKHGHIESELERKDWWYPYA